MPVTTDDLLDGIRDHIMAVERRTVISKEALEHLHEIYMLCGCEWYDPDNAFTKAFADKIWPHIKALNEELKFKR